MISLNLTSGVKLKQEQFTMPDISMFYCRTCGLRDNNGLCHRYNEQREETDFCSKRVRSVYDIICDICGRLSEKLQILDINDKTICICDACADTLNSCQTCLHALTCEFETNSSTIPKMIQKQIRQGYVTAITQVQNPERIKITCAQGCPCYDPKSQACLRPRGACQQYSVLVHSQQV